MTKLAAISITVPCLFGKKYLPAILILYCSTQNELLEFLHEYLHLIN